MLRSNRYERVAWKIYRIKNWGKKTTSPNAEIIENEEIVEIWENKANGNYMTVKEEIQMIN